MKPKSGERHSHPGESGVRYAAMLLIDELGETAAAYAAMRAIVLQKRGDEIGASAWRRVAPMIDEMQRKRATGSS